MSKPFVKHFNLPDNKEVTTIVLDKAEFDALCDELVDLFNSHSQPGHQIAQAFKEAENIPVMSRGTKTQKFFDRWGVKTDLASIIVRGAGLRVLMRLGLDAAASPKPHPEPSNN